MTDKENKKSRCFDIEKKNNSKKKCVLPSMLFVVIKLPANKESRTSYQLPLWYWIEFYEQSRTLLWRPTPPLKDSINSQTIQPEIRYNLSETTSHRQILRNRTLVLRKKKFLTWSTTVIFKKFFHLFHKGS